MRASHGGSSSLHVHREGRQLVYDLSSGHHCGLLSYAIQQIMMHGHEDEVASIGAPLAAYFMVFHTILASRLREVPSASPARLAELARELKVSPPLPPVPCQLAGLQLPCRLLHRLLITPSTSTCPTCLD